MNRAYIEAVELLGSFKLNTPVHVVVDGRKMDVYVSRTIHRSDGSFGSFESSRVTVTYGPGRYATEITADMLVLGTATIETRKGEVCFCGEAIDYDAPGSEGGEFTATKKFARKYPDHEPGDAVIAHAQCGLDHGLEPA